MLSSFGPRFIVSSFRFVCFVFVCLNSNRIGSKRNNNNNNTSDLNFRILLRTKNIEGSEYLFGLEEGIHRLCNINIKESSFPQSYCFLNEHTTNTVAPMDGETKRGYLYHADTHILFIVFHAHFFFFFLHCRLFLIPSHGLHNFFLRFQKHPFLFLQFFLLPLPL